jgi:hypothetical protein
MKRYFKIIVSISISIYLLSCDVDERLPSDDVVFLKIYDDNQFDASYIPLDVKHTADSGYVILAARRIGQSDFSGIQVLKADKHGEFVSQRLLNEQWVNPVKSLLPNGEGFSFIAMNATTLQSHIIDVNTEGVTSEPRPIGGSTYPLYFAPNGNGFLLLSYNSIDRETVLSQLGPNGNLTASRGYGIGAGDGVDKPIIEHFTRTGRQLPFFCGTSDQGLYFNEFFNFTMSLVFVNLAQEAPRAVIQGQQERGGIGALLPLGGNNFALSVFNFGDKYYNSFQSLNATGIVSATDFAKNPMPELTPDAPVRMIPMSLDGRNVTMIASNTKRGEILLSAYDAGSGTLMGTKYLGFSNPFEVANLAPTLEGGLAVVGTTYATGRFARVCLFKLSVEDLRTWVR